ncbi:MAG: hypothetical protein M3O50_07295 [Myxococcota bacterium]|nr:hypothetical protein [Myxococcota bacterium]
MDTDSLTVHESKLRDLHTRAALARDALRAAGLRVGGVGGLEAIQAALDELARLLPGLTEPPRTLLGRTLRDLAAQERSALREAIEVERVARARLAKMLGGVSRADAEEALARIETQESIATELLLLLGRFERTYRAGSPPILA